jgi:hypothetical protein
MSTQTTVAPAPRRGRLRRILRYVFSAQRKEGELVVISHSNLFYWWPVWLVAFLLAGLTYYHDTQMAVVPEGTVAAQDRLVEVEPGKELQKRDVLIFPQGAALPTRKDAEGKAVPEQPRIFMAASKNPGVLFAFVLLLIIILTNIPMRGPWSLLVVSVLVLLSLIFAQLGLWEAIFTRTRLLAIHINMGGYLFLGLALFIAWLVGLVFFDRQFYVTVTPGQVRVHLEIGGGETAYDTTGMVFQKQRSDMFRHWILGFGSGDLIIRPASSREHVELHNVLFVGRKVRQIERYLQQKAIVTG